MYRIGALIAAPLLFFGLLELGLRLAGYGTPTSFFLPASLDGKPSFIENQEFSRVFFPPGLERHPLPCRLDASKAPGTKRVFIFGESAAMGDPAPAFGLARAFEMLLRERYPETRFEFVNVSMTAINSHVLLPIARECASKEGDLWVIYMGNNEVVGPFGAGTVFGAKTPLMLAIRASVALKSSRTGQWLARVFAKLGSRGGPREWGGMEMFLKQQVSAAEPGLERVYSHFDQNLREIVELGNQSGAKVVLSTLAGNLKDCAPFASLHRQGLSPSDLAAWDRAYAEGCRLQGASDPGKASELFRQATQFDADYADAWYRLGQCLLASGNEKDARPAFENALEKDTLRFRPDRRIEGIIRQNAKNGVLLADAQADVAAQSPHGLAGDELLYEHVHPAWEGAYRIGLSLAEQAGRALADLRPATTNWLSMDECAARLGLTDWSRAQTTDLMVRRMQEPPFSTQSDHAARDRRWRERAEQFKARLASQSPDAPRQILSLAAERHPADWQIRQTFAKYLEDTGAGSPALAQWTETLRLMPHDSDVACARASLLDKLGRPAEAAAAFEEALRWAPESGEACNGLGLAFDAQGKPGRALDCYKTAVRLNPRLVEAWVNLGSANAGMGLTNEAFAAFGAALAARSNSPAALSAMARLLAKTGRPADALSHYRRAVEAAPEDATIRLAFAADCEALGMADEAVAQLSAAVKLRPDLAEAHLSLGLELAKAARKEEALAEFQQAANLAPDSAPAHYNLGVALAQGRRWAEAAAQFREALRIEPGNPQFKRSFDTASARQQGRQ